MKIRLFFHIQIFLETQVIPSNTNENMKPSEIHHMSLNQERKDCMAWTVLDCACSRNWQVHWVSDNVFGNLVFSSSLALCQDVSSHFSWPLAAAFSNLSYIWLLICRALEKSENRGFWNSLPALTGTVWVPEWTAGTLAPVWGPRGFVISGGSIDRFWLAVGFLIAEWTHPR